MNGLSRLLALPTGNRAGDSPYPLHGRRTSCAKVEICLQASTPCAVPAHRHARFDANADRPRDRI